MEVDDAVSDNNYISTIAEVRKWASAYLTTCDVPYAIKESDYLLAHLLDRDRSIILAYPDKELSPQTVAQYCKLVKTRGRGIPLAYLTGRKEFMGLDFQVDENVLVPRPDTEILVEAVLEVVSSTSLSTPLKLLDLCSGSGNIALAVAYYCQKEFNISVEITLADISIKALEVAEQNARHLGLADYCKFVASDLFTNIGETDFDIITVNPPYVSEEEYRGLSKEVKSEPKTALIANEKGLEYYKLIAAQYCGYLHEQGYLFMEIGAEQQEAVETLFAQNCKQVSTRQDLAGRPRVVVVN